MTNNRFLSLLDLTVAIVVLVVLILPPRATEALAANQGTDDELRSLAIAEADAVAHPLDGDATAEWTRRLGDVGNRDWEITAAITAANAQLKSPTRWHSLLAVSVGYADLLAPGPALEWGNRALAACAEVGTIACPTWEQVRMDLYARHLDAGVKSGIDPRVDLTGYRKAADSGVRTIRLNGGPSAAPTPSGMTTPLQTPPPAAK